MLRSIHESPTHRFFAGHSWRAWMIVGRALSRKSPKLSSLLASASSLAQYLRLMRKRVRFLAGLGIVLVVLSVSLFAASIAPYNPLDVRFEGHEPPSTQHWLGTDNLGRDILSRVLWGARISILFSVVAATLSLVFGSLLGGSSAYLGKVYDELVSKFLDVMLMLPRLLLLILLVAMFGSNLWSTVLVVGLTQSPVAGKLMRGQVLSLRSREYITAAVVSGASDWRILVRHILPNALPILITNGTLQIAEAIMLEAG